MKLSSPTYEIINESSNRSKTGNQFLIIDSNEIVAKRIKAVILNIGGFCIGIASDFISAERLIRKQKPDYILINTELDGLFTGFQTAKILQLDYEIPIILVGNSQDPEMQGIIDQIEPESCLYENDSDLELGKKLLALTT